MKTTYDDSLTPDLIVQTRRPAELQNSMGDGLCFLYSDTMQSMTALNILCSAYPNIMVLSIEDGMAKGTRRERGWIYNDARDDLKALALDNRFHKLYMKSLLEFNLEKDSYTKYYKQTINLFLKEKLEQYDNSLICELPEKKPCNHVAFNYCCEKILTCPPLGTSMDWCAQLLRQKEAKACFQIYSGYKDFEQPYR